MSIASHSPEHMRVTSRRLHWVDTALQELLAARARLGHALLVTGPRASGKSDLAARFARALLCESPAANGESCGRCAACQWVDQDNHPDLRVVQPLDEEAAQRAGRSAKPSKDIRIEQVRELAGFVSLGAHRGGRRVILIDPADRMNAFTANALLKTLEEPGGTGLQFVLVTHDPHALPATILSRCARYALRVPSRDEQAHWLSADDSRTLEDARQCVALAGGLPLFALEQFEGGQSAVHRTLMEAVSRLPETGIPVVADAIASVPTAQMLGFLQAWVADLGRCAIGLAPDRFLGAKPRLAELARRTNLARVVGLAAWIDRQAGAAEHPLNARLACESALIRYAGLFDRG